MRSFYLVLLSSTALIRTSIATAGRRGPHHLSNQIPTLQYPICRRNFTCSAPSSQNFQTIMADLSKETVQEELDRLAEPASKESEILRPKETEEALRQEEGHSSSSKEANEIKEAALPELSASDHRAYNSMAEHMEYFHNHFRQSWTLLYKACETGTRPKQLTLKQFLQTGLQFCSHLTTHHAIEEQHIFPVLAQKMPEFQNGKGNNAAELLRQHREIHKGMDEFEAYLRGCTNGQWELSLPTLKEKMDSWGTVLWTHLDQEVKTLGAENMRKYWTVEQMRRMPM